MPTASASPHASAVYGRLPLAFEANHGQTDSRVRFLARGHGSPGSFEVFVRTPDRDGVFAALVAMAALSLVLPLKIVEPFRSNFRKLRKTAPDAVEALVATAGPGSGSNLLFVVMVPVLALATGAGGGATAVAAHAHDRLGARHAHLELHGQQGHARARNRIGVLDPRDLGEHLLGVRRRAGHPVGDRDLLLVGRVRDGHA